MHDTLELDQRGVKSIKGATSGTKGAEAPPPLPEQSWEKR